MHKAAKHTAIIVNLIFIFKICLDYNNHLNIIENIRGSQLKVKHVQSYKHVD